MPGGNKDKDTSKTVQTMLAPKKDLNKGGAKESQGNPAKRDKRTHLDVSEDSMDTVNLLSIHSDLVDIKKPLQDTASKSDLDSLVKQKDLKELVTNIVSSLLTAMRDSIKEEFNTQLRDGTGKLQDQIDGLNFENNELKERLREKDKQIDALQEVVMDCNLRSMDALKLANYNEQYSRKHNIRMVNFPEKKGENLRNDFVKIVKEDLKVEIEPTDVIAIHRIPGKEGDIRPVIAKVKNTEIKIQIMRNKKGLKNNVKFHDDITQRNLGLLTRLSKIDSLENAWFYNCSVYGKLKDSKQKIKFDLFDNAEEKIKKKISKD